MKLREKLSYYRWPIGIITCLLSVITVDVAVCVIAIKGSTGTIEETPYEKGQRYQQEIDRQEELRRLGWKIDVAVSGESKGIEVKVTDREGKNVPNLAGTVLAIRPANAKLDHTFALNGDSSGSYYGNSSLSSGLWLLRIRFAQGDSEVLTEKKVVL